MELADYSADRDLAARAAAGDAVAQEDVLRMVLPHLRGVVFSVMPRAEAPDTVQTALLKVFESLPRYAGRSKLTTWARRIGLNTALTMRDVGRRPNRATDNDSQQLRQLRAPSSEKVMREGISRSVIEYLREITPEQRELLIVRYVEGNTLKETAAQLSLNVETAKSRLVAARKAVRKLIVRDVNVGRAGSRRGVGTSKR
ncbi:MAG: sigma-70 family RNA polymerase sigma factor [Myxococcota bacterium]